MTIKQKIFTLLKMIRILIDVLQWVFLLMQKRGRDPFARKIKGSLVSWVSWYIWRDWNHENISETRPVSWTCISAAATGMYKWVSINLILSYQFDVPPIFIHKKLYKLVG